MMGGNNSPNNRFPLPENWNVEDFICMVIPVPDDEEYISMMRGLIETLLWQRSFNQHPTENAAYQVSKTWQAAFESREIRFWECSMPDFRINPDTCLLEVNCSDDPDDPNWRPVETPDYDPSQDAPITPTYPDPPPIGQSNQCLAAANASAYLQWNAGQFASSLGSIGFVGVLIGLLYTWLSAIVNVTIGALYDTIGSSFTAFNAGTIEDDYAAIDWQEVTDILACEYEDNGVMSIEGWENVHDAFQTKLDDTGNQIWLWLRLVWNIMGTVGATVAGLWGGITEAECASCECGEWEHSIDFTTTAGGFAPFDAAPICTGSPLSEYVLGQGFHTIPNFCGTGGAICQAFIDIEETYITQIDITYTTEDDPTGVTSVAWITSGGSGESGTPVNQNTTHIRFAIGLELGDHSGAVSAIHICGNGENPFA